MTVVATLEIKAMDWLNGGEERITLEIPANKNVAWWAKDFKFNFTENAAAMFYQKTESAKDFAVNFLKFANLIDPYYGGMNYEWHKNYGALQLSANAAPHETLKLSTRHGDTVGFNYDSLGADYYSNIPRLIFGKTLRVTPEKNLMLFHENGKHSPRNYRLNKVSRVTHLGDSRVRKIRVTFCVHASSFWSESSLFLPKNEKKAAKLKISPLNSRKTW